MASLTLRWSSYRTSDSPADTRRSSWLRLRGEEEDEEREGTSKAHTSRAGPIDGLTGRSLGERRTAAAAHDAPRVGAHRDDHAPCDSRQTRTAPSGGVHTISRQTCTRGHKAPREPHGDWRGRAILTELSLLSRLLLSPPPAARASDRSDGRGGGLRWICCVLDRLTATPERADIPLTLFLCALFVSSPTSCPLRVPPLHRRRTASSRRRRPAAIRRRRCSRLRPPASRTPRSPLPLIRRRPSPPPFPCPPLTRI